MRRPEGRLFHSNLRLPPHHWLANASCRRENVFLPLRYNFRIISKAKSRIKVTASTRTDARLGSIVRLLTGHATVVASGTKIAEEIGTSRSEVWRLIQQLRGLGVDVAGHPATGYQLRAVPDLLLP